MVASYNGWSASRDPKAIGVSGGFSIAGVKFPAGVRAGAVATVFKYLAEQFNARVERLESPGCWGYYFKNSANSSHLLSCHSSGTAIDFNAPKHPNGRRGTFSRAQVAQIRAILDELGGVVYWGGDAWGNGVPDEMHFEIRTGTSEARVRAVADKLYSPKEDDLPTPNDVWMAPCTAHYPDGRKETHPAVEWITVMAIRIAELSRQGEVNTKSIQSLFDAIFHGGSSMDDHGKGIDRSIAELQAKLDAILKKMEVNPNLPPVK